MKFSEKQIQEYIWANRESFFDMIEPTEFADIDKRSPWEYEPWELLYMKIMEQYQNDFENLEGLNLFGNEVRLDKENETTIRSDFFGCFEGENGFVVCELKVNRAPERQAYTELMAYANHVRASFGMMGRQDIVYILITPMKERIVREATINTLLYDRNRIIVLEPIVEECIESLRFRLWQPSKDDFKVVTQTAFAFENIGVYKVCWDGRGRWCPSEDGVEPDTDMVHRLNQVSSYAAQIMESNGINGFVFCSQSEPAIRDQGILESSITICGINPYLAAKTRFLYERGFSLGDSASADISQFSIFNIFPSLKKNCQAANEENNYWEWMAESWQSCIDRIALDVKSRLTVSIDCDYVQIGYGGFTWKNYLNGSGEDKFCYNYNMHLTGILREIYNLYLDKLYAWALHCTSAEKQILIDNGMLEEHIMDMLNSQKHIRSFIKRLVGGSPDSTTSTPLPDDDIEIHPMMYDDEEDEDDIEQILSPL